jgi:predicted phage-related endonuclease
MGADQGALTRLWREKRGEIEPEDLSGNLIVQLGVVTEDLNRQWFERNTGRAVKDVQRWMRHPAIRWMGATLDGMVEATGSVFEAKFMLPWSFSEEGAAQKYMHQLQHNMWVTNSVTSVLSVITGGGKWVEITVPADSLYQHLLFTAEKKFWRCVENGKPPRLFGIEPPPPRIEAVRVADMSSSNSWAEFAAQFCETRHAFLRHESAKAELKALMPQDAKEAAGGNRVKRTIFAMPNHGRSAGGFQTSSRFRSVACTIANFTDKAMSARGGASSTSIRCRLRLGYGNLRAGFRRANKTALNRCMQHAIRRENRQSKHRLINP